MANIYTQNPTKSFTIHQFIEHASRLESEDTDSFIRFVLTGEFTDLDGDIKQVFIDPIQDTVTQDHRLLIARDYDSLLGIADKFLVNNPLNVWAVPHNSFSLAKSIHIKHIIEHPPGVSIHSMRLISATNVVRLQTFNKVEYHKIPNFEFGSWNSRHHLHVFFPKLWDPNSERTRGRNAHQTSERERALWYQSGFRPAIAVLLGESIASEWPATYAAERIRAQRTKGGYSWGSKQIPTEAVDDLADQIRSMLEMDASISEDDLEWARDFFVLHTIRGVKHSTYHHADDVSSDYYLDKLIYHEADLSSDVPDVGDWYVDVGIQISSDRGESMQWMTATHNEVVLQALRISDAHAERITEMNSSKYYRDPVCHLTAISGFRITPGVQAQGEFEASYLQAYTTDKTVTYNVESGHYAKFIGMKEAMGQKHPTKTIDGLYQLYKEAGTTNASSARLEVRVPFRFATQVLGFRVRG